MCLSRIDFNFLFICSDMKYNILPIICDNKGEKMGMNNLKSWLIQVLGVVRRYGGYLIRLAFNFFSYIEDCKTYSKSMFGMKYVFHYSLQLVINNFFTKIIFFFPEIHAETRVGLHITWSLKSSDQKGCWYGSTFLRENSLILNLMKIHPAVLKLFHMYRETDGEAELT
jgi:hypothetical protein